ncbi:thioredoxin family protein [Mycolicibacter hiberniae]|uniref:Thiol reductase thioredoxin n=1 Tax=Mycolicibacter hiberniae TaxID=29314 RepID=A0A7I7X6P2_9MYCO|nr:thioredoxin family protein [Mycolicibacter hiberniae]MCV7086325.1 thioredoxin family protein [Mycolicibacter hiberniae]ORV69584.1 thioredoxin [Mycolicibacter hiberniae]BBZ24517.1 thiol reductase thioredoxin [Mycolicibacter hiberniae]
MSVIAIATALLAAGAIGWWLNRRGGVLRELPERGDSTASADAAFLGLEPGRPAVVHFSAPWCGPCAGVRRVVEKVCDDLGGLPHQEVDIDANPEAARRFSVLSLPTTVIFDTNGRQRYRASGVPTLADLRSALEPLLT